MATLGSLVVSLEANIARFESDLNRASGLAESSMGRINKAASFAGEALKALAGAFAIHEIAEFIDGGIESAASLHHLSDQTGVTVESLSALRNVAKMSNTDMETVAGAVGKLSKNMAEAASGGAPKAAAAFRALGVSIKDAAGNLKDPAQMLQDLSKRLEEFRDGTAKNAAEMEIFGKSGTQMASFLKELAETGKLQATVTTQEAEEAHKFEQRLTALGIRMDDMKRHAVLPLIPAFEGIADAMGAIVDGSGAFDAFLSAIKFGLRVVTDAGLAVVMTLSNIGKDLGALGAAAVAILSGNWSQAKAIMAARREDEVRDTLAWKAAIQKIWTDPVKAAADSPGRRGGGVRDLQLDLSPPKSSHDDPLKAMLDQQIKTIDSAIAQANLAWQAGNKEADDLYKQNLVSLADYGAQKAKLLEDNFSLTQSLYDSEIAAIQRMVQVETDAKHREQMLATLSEVQGKKEQDALKYTQEKLQLTEQLRQKSEEYAKALMNLDIQYALLNDDTLTATKLQLEQQDAMLRARLVIEGNTEALAKLDAIERDALLRATNSAGAGIERAAIDYSKQISNIGKSFEDITGKMLKGVEDAFVEFARTGKLSFKSLVDSIIADLLRLATQEYLMKPLQQIIFGSGTSVGGGGGLGGLFGAAMSFFGGGGSSFGLDAGQAGSALNSINSMNVKLPGFAVGGYLAPGQWGVAGENGPERIYGGRTGVTVQPAAKDSGGGVTKVTNHFVIQAPQGTVSRATQQQIAAAAARGIAVANVRNS